MPDSSKADAIRCALSFTALSGSPTMKNPEPSPMLTSTVTVMALTPIIALPYVLTSIVSLRLK